MSEQRLECRDVARLRNGQQQPGHVLRAFIHHFRTRLHRRGPFGLPQEICGKNGLRDPIVTFTERLRNVYCHAALYVAF
jgi:hypothetical protein